MPSPVVDAGRFKEVLGSVAAPVAVVTSHDDGRAHGTTVSAFCSLSLDPPMVLVSLDRGSRLLARVRGSGRFAINVLADGQEQVARHFASRAPDKFDGVAWEDHGGLPRLPASRGFIACRAEREVVAGDHILLLGIVEYAERSTLPALVYCERAFHGVGEPA